MKKFIITIIALGMIVNTYAQKRSGFGVHAGVIGTGVYDTELGVNPDHESATGFTFGAGYNLKFGPIGVCAELNFVNKKVSQFSSTGYNYNDDYTEVLSWNLTDVYMFEDDEITERSYNYMAIPIIAKFYLGPLNLQLGAQTSFLLGGYEKADYWKDLIINGDDIPFPESTVSFNDELIYAFSDGTSYTDKVFYSDGYVNDVEDEFFKFSNMDIAVVFGVGLDLKMGLYASVRGTASITPLINMDIVNDINQDAINQELDDPYYNDQDIRLLERLFTSEITIGYRF